MTELTMVFSVYSQPLMLARQLGEIRSYSKEVHQNLNLVVVDDCGSVSVDAREIEAIAVGLKSAKLFRVTKDIPWNQHGCRNLAAQESSGWLLFMDPDFIFDNENIKRMLQATEKLPRGHVIKYGLKHVSSGRLDMTSPNTWIIHRDDFFAVGGADEDFSGHKGWADTVLLDVLSSCYKVNKRPDLFAHFHGTDSVSDAQVITLDRSVKHNRTLRLKKVAQAKACGGWKQWVKKHKGQIIRFPWVQVFPPIALNT